ncbi:MAG: 30S ribosomal protein S3ae [Thermoplasmataceae archaeon]|jgi:small subunit ribosomal protein S3Ae
MASERTQRKTKDKWKEKTWYTISSPSYMGGKELITSLGNSPESMVGRKIEIPVSDITGNFKKGTTKVVFRITDCEGTKCSTDFIGHYVSDDYIRRMVRRRKERIDIVSKFKTSDDYIIAIKSVIVSDAKLNSNKRSSLRRKIFEVLNQKVMQSSYHDICSYIIGDDIQNDIIEATKNIYPVKKLEVRKSEVIGKTKSVVQAPVAEETSATV